MRLLLLFIFLPISLFAQKDTSFWFAAPDVNQFSVTNPHDRPILLRLTTFTSPSTITISIPANPSFTPLTNTILANSSGIVDLSAWANQIENATPNTVNDKGILIRATTDITAYYEVVSSCNCNPELFSLKGRNSLGIEFIIPSQTEWAIDTVRFPQAKAGFDIIATEDNTVINITPSKHLVGRLPGIPFSLSLNKGQTFSNQALYRSGISLLNGSIVTSSKPIAITTYEDLLMADGPCADLAGDQLIPTSIWGNEFVVVKGDLTNKDKVVITAMIDGTTIYLNGNATPAATINRGKSYEFNLSSQPVSYITSNNKISLYHYTGVNCEIGSAVIPKINCTGSNDVAITRSIDEDAVVFITTRSGAQSGFTVNGSNTIITAADFFPVPGSGGNYVFCKKNLNAVMPTGSPTRFINSVGKFQLGFLNGATPFSYSGCRYGFFSDFKSSNVTRSQVEICRYDSAQLYAFGGVTYQWSPTIGLNNAFVANPKASPGVATTYKVIITTAEGCLDSAFVSVNFSSVSTEFYYKQLVCSPLTLEFSNQTPTTNAFWDFGDNTTQTGNWGPQHTYTAPGNYVVKFLATIPGAGCTDTVIKTISVRVVPDNLILTPDTTICSGGSKQLQTVPALSFCWSPHTYLDNPNSPNPITSTPVPITYYFNAEIPGANIISNGNFSAGNTGFTSQYAYAANNVTEGEYFVGPSPQAWNAALSNCTDHTTGSGNMLLVNGSPVPNVEVWKQTVTVTPNTNYAFSSWIQALYPPNPAQLKFSINGTDIGNFIIASLPTCTWKQYYTTWNSGNSTSALISIVNKNTIVQGNDFALDDISFAPVFIRRDSVKISVDTPMVKTITDTAACMNTSTTLTTIGAASYSWTPSTGLSATNIANPVATPVITTEYIVSGTSAFGCVVKDSVTVTVKPAPVIVKSANDTICTLQSAQLNVSGGVSYSWSPGTTLNNPSIPNPIATPTSNTTYTVTVTGSNSCIKTDSIKISLETVVVSTIVDAAACLNTGTTLNTTGASQYSWFPATGLSASNIASPVATPAVNTQYVVTGTSAGGCIDTDTVNISIKPLPTVMVSPGDAICLKQSVQLQASGGVAYSWLPAQTLSNAGVANPMATPLNVTTYVVTVTGANNCINKDSVIISVKALPVISKSANDTICITQSAQLSATGGVSYVWSPTASLSNANIPNPVATPIATTNYYVTVTGTNNCSNTDSVNIRVNALPVFSVIADASTCVNGNAQLNAFGGNSYTWSPVALLTNALISNPVATAVPTNTLFTVIIRDNVCNLQQTFSTTVRTNLAPPIINATKSNDIDCVFAASQLNVSGSDTYSWSPATGLSGTNIRNPVARPAISTQYTVQGINNFTNCKSTDTITVLIKAPAAPAAFIPNSFTPNGDGLNDCFRVKDFGTVKTIDLIIYNRYGNLVFQTKNAAECWDGRYKGQPADAGNYVYYIKVLNDCGEEIKKGNLLLLR